VIGLCRRLPRRGAPTVRGKAGRPKSHRSSSRFSARGPRGFAFECCSIASFFHKHFAPTTRPGSKPRVVQRLREWPSAFGAFGGRTVWPLVPNTMILRLLHLVVLVGLAVAVVVSVAAAAQPPSPLPPPGIHSNPAWHTVTTGPTSASQHLQPQLFAITARANPDALIPFGFYDGLKKLDGAAALIVATTISKTGHPFTFRRVFWPPRLIDFRVDHGWKGQPLVRIQQRLLAIAVGGWNLDVRVYFGSQHPSQSLLASVQAELNRLTVPAP
jgi:hypothetical protein